MIIAQLIPLTMARSIFLSVFALGLTRQVNLLYERIDGRSRDIAAKLFGLDPAVKIAIVALAISPVPLIFPKKQRKVGATDSYAISLLV